MSKEGVKTCICTALLEFISFGLLGWVSLGWVIRLHSDCIMSSRLG